MGTKLDEMMAAAIQDADRWQKEKERAATRAREDAIAAAKMRAEGALQDLLGTDLYLELGVEVEAKHPVNSSLTYYGVGSFTYADETWCLKYDDQTGRFAEVSTPVLIVDVPGLPDERRWDATKRHGESRFTSHYDKKLLILLAAYAQDKAAQIEAHAQAQKENEERAERVKRENVEREARQKQLVADAKKEEAAIIAEAEVYFGEQRAGMWRWPTGYVLTLYHWRWCIGYTPDGGVEYDEAYALTDTLSTSLADDGGWITTFAHPSDRRVLKLIPEAHKPVVTRKEFTSVADLDGALCRVTTATYGHGFIKRQSVGEWPNSADLWTRVEPGSTWTSGISRTIGYEPVTWLANYIDVENPGIVARDPLPPMEQDEDATRPYVEDLPF